MKLYGIILLGLSRCLRRYLDKPMSIKLCSFISRLQKLNAYLKEFHPDTEGQETAPLPADEIMDIIYHSMPIMRENKMIEEDFSYTISTVKKICLKLGYKIWSPRKIRKNLKQLPKNPKKKLTNERKKKDSNSTQVS